MARLLMLVSVQGEAMIRDVLELSLGVRDRYETHVLVPSDAYDAFARAGIEARVWRPSGFIGMGTAVARLRTKAAAFAPDVIHAHGFPAIAVALGTFPGALARRTIATFHDPQRDKELPRKLVERRLPGYLARGSALVATYPSLARTLETKFALAEGTIDVIPHGVGIPLDGGAPFARPAGRPGPIVGWRGSLSADRAWETAIDAFALVRDRFPDARLEISGGGRARQFVQAYVRQNGLGPIVNFRGEEAAAEFFANVDVLVVPISRDAQPQAPLEALVAGVPVVAANAGALADALHEMETGWLVPDDAAGFAQGIEAAWAAIEAAWAGAARQRATARERYARDVTVAAYVAEYATAAGVSGVTRAGEF